MINKVVQDIETAVAGVKDGATIMIGGFGAPGIPHNLVKALAKSGAKNLTLICSVFVSLTDLPDGKAVSKIITSFAISPYGRSAGNPLAEGVLSGEIEVELVPVGNLAERIRAGGAGIPAFFTPIGVDTLIEKGKERRSFGGREYFLETGLRADFAFIKGYKADTKGNLVYKGAMSNFNSIMAMSAKVVVAEVEEIVPAGDLAPGAIVTPGIYVDRVVKVAPIDVPFVQARNFDKPMKGWSGEQLSARVARDLKDGMYVNVGSGMPANVSNYIPDGVEVMLEAENGILGFGPLVDERMKDPDFLNAGARPVSLVPGASLFDCTQSFNMLRGGHIDLTILGAYQVSERGDLANWMTSGQKIGGIGGAMDVAVGADQVWIMMEHTAELDAPKILRNCTYPLTAKGVVNRIYTNLAIIEVGRDGLVLTETAPGVTAEEVQAVTEPVLRMGRDIRKA